MLEKSLKERERLQIALFCAIMNERSRVNSIKKNLAPKADGKNFLI